MKKRSIQYNFIMNFILQASAILFPLITFPYVSRVLLPAGTGKVAFATSTVAYFTMAAMLGIPTYGVRAIAQVRHDPKQLALRLRELLTINLIMSVCAYAAFFICLAYIPKMASDKPLMLISSAAILLNVIGINWFFQGIEDYSYITWVSMIFKVVSVITMFLFVRAEKDYLWYAVMTVLSSYGSGLVNLFAAWKYLKPGFGMKMNFRIHMRPILVFFAMSVATTVYTNLDTVMLGSMKTDYDVGIYNAAIKIKSLLVVLVTSLGTVLLPRLSEYASEGESEKFRALISKAFSFVLLFSVPVCLFSMAYAGEIVLFLSGKSYMPAVIPMLLLMPTLVLIGLSNLTGIQILVPTGRENVVLASVIAGALLDLAVNWILIPGYGASGAAMGTLLAETLVLAWQCWVLRSLLKQVLPNAEWKQLFAALLASCPFLFLNLVPAFASMPVFFRLLAGGILYFGFVFMALICTKEQIILNVLKKGKQK